jgi:hypothetical protein
MEASRRASTALVAIGRMDYDIMDFFLTSRYLGSIVGVWHAFCFERAFDLLCVI